MCDEGTDPASGHAERRSAQPRGRSAPRPGIRARTRRTLRATPFRGCDRPGSARPTPGSLLRRYDRPVSGGGQAPVGRRWRRPRLPAHGWARLHQHGPPDTLFRRAAHARIARPTGATAQPGGPADPVLATEPRPRRSHHTPATPGPPSVRIRWSAGRGRPPGREPARPGAAPREGPPWPAGGDGRPSPRGPGAGADRSDSGHRSPLRGRWRHMSDSVPSRARRVRASLPRHASLHEEQDLAEILCQRFRLIHPAARDRVTDGAHQAGHLLAIFVRCPCQGLVGPDQDIA